MKAFDILSELSEHITIKMSSCYESFHDRDWMESKAHHDYDIWYITGGTVGLEIEGLNYTAAEGDIIFFYPGIPYSACTGENGCSFIYVHFEFGIGNNFRILDEFDFAGIISSKAIGKEASVFKEGWLACKENSNGVSFLLKGYFIVLLAGIIRLDDCADPARIRFPEGGRSKRSGYLVDFQPVFKHISDSLYKKIKIHELSSIAGMSEKYFIGVFKNTVGVTPNVYIHQIKMNHAREYLYQRKHSIKQIANLLGYPDQYSFSKAFKKYFNVPPSKFL